jgi:hypothetical protein
LVERALNDLECEIKEGKHKDNRAAWLTDMLKRWDTEAPSAPTKPQPHGTREPLKKFQPCPELAQNFRAGFAKAMEAAQPG